MRGDPRDYDGWQALGCEGWAYEGVLPYFRRAESSWRGEGPAHGADGPLRTSPGAPRRLQEAFLAAAQHQGHALREDLNEAPSTRAPRRWNSPSTRWGRRSSASRAYLRPAARRPNLTVVTGAVVARVLVQGGRAIGLEVLRNGSQERIQAGSEVVLCAGGYLLPKLLLLSGVGPAAELARHGINPVKVLPGVGKRLYNHPMLRLRRAAAAPVSFVNELRLDRMAARAVCWELEGSGPFASLPSAGRLLARTQHQLVLADIQISAWATSMDAKPWFPGWCKPAPHAFDIGISLLRPRSHGSVRLVSTDPRAAPAAGRGPLCRPRRPGDHARRGAHGA